MYQITHYQRMWKSKKWLSSELYSLLLIYSTLIKVCNLENLEE